jgi:hypothetical protein
MEQSRRISMSLELPQPRKVFPLKVDDAGRMVIPADAHVRQALRDGETLVGVEEADGSFRVKTHAEVIREIQDYMAQFVPPGVVLSEELLKERREEAARE